MFEGSYIEVSTTNGVDITVVEKVISRSTEEMSSEGEGIRVDPTGETQRLSISGLCAGDTEVTWTSVESTTLVKSTEESIRSV